MTDQSKRGGMKETPRTGNAGQHQGVHPGSTTQNKEGGGDKHAGEQIVPKKESYESDKR